MKMRPSYIVAAVAVISLALWFGLRSGDSEADVYADIEAKNEPAAVNRPTVVYRPVQAESHAVRLTSYGRTQPNRMVEVRAKTPGPVSRTPVAEGARVSRGTLLCQQDTDARQAMVDQASAQLRKAQADLEATQTLVEKGYRSPTQLNGDQAALDAARANLKSAQIELDNINLRAPFAGIFEARSAEVGDYLAPGGACGTVVELNPLKVEVELTETQVGRIEAGQPVDVSLATGEAVTGSVAFIESVANPSTRTFTMELKLPNPDMTLKAGVSTTINLKIGETMASPVPSGILALNDDGVTGVRYLDANDVVQFARIEQIDETDKAIWVTGLPARTRIIVEGQDYVSVGTTVQPVLEGERASNAPASAGLSPTAKLD